MLSRVKEESRFRGRKYCFPNESLYTLQTEVIRVAQRRRDELIAAKQKQEPAPSEGRCQIQDLFGLLGKPYSLDLLHLLVERSDPRRFVEIQDALGISPKTLTVRLREFVDAGLFVRTAYKEIPPRVDYEATDKARQLKPLFSVLSDWSQSHDLRPVASAAD